jgi:phosphatidylglycerol lysyltransferase
VRRDGRVRAVGPKVYWRAAVAAGLGCLFLGLLAHRLQTVEPALISQAMGRVGLWAWLGAAMATWASFHAVAGYDLTLHRHMATGVAPARARRAGFAAIAIAQTVGMGVLSGALIRWRMLPELGLWGATRLALAVAVSFLMAWALLGALVIAVLGGPFAALGGWGLAGAALAILGLAALARPGLPNLITLSRLLVLAAVDCGAAGLALWLLVPGDLGFAEFLPVFMLALGAGLVSGSPAGLGAFEITLLALLPMMPEAELLAGVVAWRILYYAAPAVIGAGVALWPGPEAEGSTRRRDAPALAEGGLVAQGELAVHPAGFVAGRTAHGLVALSAVADPGLFRAAARDEGRWPVLYKACARQAAEARRAGMVVLPLGREAWLDPQSFRLDLPARAGLRRKLRRAEAAGVGAELATLPDWSALAAVNAAWAQARGGEHGFSMGRFDPCYLAGQR